MVAAWLKSVMCSEVVAGEALTSLQSDLQHINPTGNRIQHWIGSS